MLEKRAFLISLTLSAVAAYLVYQYIAAEDVRLNDQYGIKITLVRAKKNILQYQTIKPTDLEPFSVPIALRPPGYIVNIEDVYDAVAAVPIIEGEYVLDNKIISRNIYSGLESQVSREKRALSVPVNVKSSIGYNLRPGNRVDLAAHFQFKAASTSISEVKVFMQDLLVLASGRTIQSTPPKAVDQDVVRSILNMDDKTIPKEPLEIRETLNFAKTDTNYQTVTLEVTPEQAQQIVYVMTTFGESLTLLLRHSDDRKIERRGTTNLVDVMGPDSHLVMGNRGPNLVPQPKLRFQDYVGEDVLNVYEEQK